MTTFATILVVVLLLYLIGELSSTGSRDARKSPDENLLKLSEAIDASLRGYPGRHKNIYENHVYWGCESRLFTIDLTLRQTGSVFTFTTSFHCNLKFELSVGPAGWLSSRLLPSALSGTKLSPHFSVKAGRDELSKELMKAREMIPLLEGVRFFDYLKVHHHGVLGSKNIRTASDLEDWHKTLGSTITLVRFLLNFQERKLLPESSEGLCPYCRGMLAEKEFLVSCHECRTVHHRDCWDETGNCSVFGCPGRNPLDLLAP